MNREIPTVPNETGRGRVSAAGHPIKDARIFSFQGRKGGLNPTGFPPPPQDGVVSAGFAVLSASGESPLVRLVLNRGQVRPEGGRLSDPIRR